MFYPLEVEFANMARQPQVTRRSFLVGGAAMVAGAICAGSAGCASASNSTGASDASGASAASANASASEPAESKILTGASAHAGANFNPIGFCGGESLPMAATRHVFEGLYELDMRTFRPYEALAAGQPEMLSSTSCEIVLRDGAQYSDGTAVTAQDVENAFAKNMAVPTMGALLDCIDSVAAKDDRTVVITLKYPMGDLLTSRLSLVKVFPANREAELDTLPVGSGPWAYAPDGLDGKKKVDFVPNPHYNGQFPAEADSMTWTVLSDSGDERANALGDHVVQVAEAVPSGSVTQLERWGVRAEHVQGFGQPFLMFNLLKKPFSDKRVRQALFYAIDVKKLIEEQMDGHATPLTCFVPKGHPNHHRASTVYEHDPEKAQALLTAAGIKRLEFTLTVNNNWVADLAPSIADDLKSCGIDCTIVERAIRWNEFADTGKVLPYDAVLASGDPSRFGNDPDLLLSWWYGDNVWTRGRSCWARAAEGSFDEMQALLLAARAAEGDERQELWNRCFDIVADEVPLYGLFHRKLTTAWQPDDITGFRPISVPGLDFLGCTVA